MNHANSIYCPRCGKQILQKNRYCPGCGTRVDFIIEMMNDDDIDIFQREKHRITGIKIIFSACIMGFLFLSAFGLITLLTNMKEFWTLFSVWIAYTAPLLTFGSIGFWYLLKGKFFSFLKKQDAKIKLIEAKYIDKENRGLVNSSTEQDGHRIITEATTQQLDKSTNKYT